MNEHDYYPRRCSMIAFILPAAFHLRVFPNAPIRRRLLTWVVLLFGTCVLLRDVYSQHDEDERSMLHHHTSYDRCVFVAYDSIAPHLTGIGSSLLSGSVAFYDLFTAVFLPVKEDISKCILV